MASISPWEISQLSPETQKRRAMCSFSGIRAGQSEPSFSLFLPLNGSSIVKSGGFGAVRDAAPHRTTRSSGDLALWETQMRIRSKLYFWGSLKIISGFSPAVNINMHLRSPVKVKTRLLYGKMTCFRANLFLELWPYPLCFLGIAWLE